MRTGGNIRLGRTCKRHPELNGRRYVANNNCTECCKERGRKVYAALDLTPSQKITTLLAERDQLKAENEALRDEIATNCNADVAKFLREMADNVEAGSHGEIRQVALIMEAGSDANTWVAGGPCDNARIVGLMSIATARFIREMQS